MQGHRAADKNRRGQGNQGNSKAHREITRLKDHKDLNRKAETRDKDHSSKGQGRRARVKGRKGRDHKAHKAEAETNASKGRGHQDHKARNRNLLLIIDKIENAT